jgi:SAM-dependent methyltransferase
MPTVNRPIDTIRAGTAPVLERVRGALQLRLRRLERTVYRKLLRVGRRAICPVCGWHGLRFRPSSRPRVPDRLCPGCGSSERYRAFELWLRRNRPHPQGGRLLEIAPIALIEPTARELGYDYSSLDLSSSRAGVLADLCHAPFSDGCFDLIVCYHVLEHIPADREAMAEIRRLLKPSGLAVVIVPWEPDRDRTFEGASDDPADNLRLYGQSDHVRIYGADFTDRLRSVGLEVEQVFWHDEFTPDVMEQFRLVGNDDRFWMCRLPA